MNYKLQIKPLSVNLNTMRKILRWLGFVLLTKEDKEAIELMTRIKQPKGIEYYCYNCGEYKRREI